MIRSENAETKKTNIDTISIQKLSKQKIASNKPEACAQKIHTAYKIKQAENDKRRWKFLHGICDQPEGLSAGSAEKRDGSQYCVNQCKEWMCCNK